MTLEQTAEEQVGKYLASARRWASQGGSSYYGMCAQDSGQICRFSGKGKRNFC